MKFSRFEASLTRFGCMQTPPFKGCVPIILICIDQLWREQVSIIGDRANTTLRDRMNIDFRMNQNL